MPFELDTAVPVEGKAISTTTFDLTTAQELNPEPKQVSPISSFLRSIFRNSPIEQMKTAAWELQNIDKAPAPKEGESIQDFGKRWNEFLQPRENEIISQGVMRQVDAPMTLAIGAGAVAAPVATAVGVGGFTIADHFFNARRWLDENVPNTSPTMKDVAEILDFVAKGAAIGGGFKAVKDYTVNRANDLNLPKSVELSPEHVAALKEIPKAAESIGLKPEHIEASVNGNVPVKVPLSDFLNLADNAAWESIKSSLVGEVRAPEPLDISLADRAVGGIKDITLSDGSKVGEIAWDNSESNGGVGKDFTIKVNEEARLGGVATAAIQKAFDSGLYAISGKLGFDKPVEFWKKIGANVNGDNVYLTKEKFNEYLQSKAEKQTESILNPNNPVDKVIAAIKEAKPVRGQQERMYSAERGKRMAAALAMRDAGPGGEKGFRYELKQLAGELPKAQFEGIRDKVTQADVDALFNMVQESNQLGFWETVTARTALAKLFGEMGGQVPTKGEIALLNKVFGNKFAEAILDKRPAWDKFVEGVSQVLNVPRSIMSSFDMSAPLRQGLFFVGRKEFYPAFKDMFKFFVSDKNLQAMQEEIASRPTFELAKDSGLALTDLNVQLEGREEAFMSNLAEKIPVIGKGVRASGRAYVGFLNKLRADSFDSMIRDAERLGLDPKENRDLAREIASFINTATGRGELGALSNSAVALNNIFFSPRLIASRLSLLNPQYYASRSPYVRQQALKSLFTLGSIGATVLTLSSLSGAKVGTDPRSSDFGKIIVHNTRVDIWGGFQPYVRMASQLWTGKYVSSTTGRVVTLGEGYKPLTRLDILQRQVESKLAPIASFIVTMLKGQTWNGEKVKVSDEVVNRLTPMVAGDVVTVIKDDPSVLPLEVLNLFGVGVNTYEKRKR